MPWDNAGRRSKSHCGRGGTGYCPLHRHVPASVGFGHALGLHAKSAAPDERGTIRSGERRAFTMTMKTTAVSSAMVAFIFAVGASSCGADRSADMPGSASGAIQGGASDTTHLFAVGIIAQ